MEIRDEPTRAGLYVHVPFCRSVCPYCDFAVTITGSERKEEYLDAMIRESEIAARGGWDPFDTIYLGGGTPSQLSPVLLERLLGQLRDRFRFEPGASIFMEANPEDVDRDSASAWKRMGISTVSLGIQSFDERVLSFLGRGHAPVQAKEAVRVLRQAGFTTVAGDLIFGVPGMDEAGWRKQLEIAVATGLDHLSCYELTVHPDTVFGKRRQRGELDEVHEKLRTDQFFLTHEVLADLGLPGYEVSNFARSIAHRSRHNLKYWRHEPYLGLGPSAHSFRGRSRWWNLRKLRLWAAKAITGTSPIQDSEHLTPIQLATEAVMLGLRLTEGVDLGAVEMRLGVELLQPNEELVADCVKWGLLVVEGTTIRPTLDGLALADSVAGQFVVKPRAETQSQRAP